MTSISSLYHHPHKSCERCVGDVKIVLRKLDGVESYDIDLKEQKVVVKGNVEPDTVLKAVPKLVSQPHSRKLKPHLSVVNMWYEN